MSNSNYTKPEGTAEWDQRQQFHTRIHESILLCSSGLFERDYRLWLNGLTMMEIALKPFMTKEQEESIKKKMKLINNLLRSNIQRLDITPFFQSAQEDLHKVMRSRGFDVPINEFRPGSIIQRERSF